MARTRTRDLPVTRRAARGVSSARITLPASRPSPAETVKIGRYEVTGELGQGGMGHVLAARDPALEREVAVKVVRAPAEARALEAFAREAKITGALEPPNIVPIHELGHSADGRPYFAMKKVEGRTLEQLLRARHGQEPLAGILGVFLKVCDAIAFAHARGVIHRDLKPANIMVGEFGEVLVMDWGLAKRLGTHDAHSDRVALAPRGDDPDSPLATLDGTVVGTPAYMPPEQAAGQIAKVGKASDVYALGAILYEVLAGAPPFEGPSVWAVLARVLEGPPVPPGERAPGRIVPWELEAAAMRAMATEPRKRYPSVSALASDVAGWLEGRTLAAARYTIPQRVAKWLARHRTVAAALAAAVLVPLAIGAFTALEARTARRAHNDTALAAAHARVAHAHDLPALRAAATRATTDGGTADDAERRAGWTSSVAGWLAAVSDLDRALALDPAEPRLVAARRTAGEALGLAAALGGDRTLARQSFSDLVRWGVDSSETLRQVAWVDLVDGARARARATRLDAMIEDVSRGLACRDRHFPTWRLDDYVAEAASYRDQATARRLSAVANALAARARADGPRARWLPTDRALAQLVCRALGRNGCSEAVPPLVDLVGALWDPSLVAEAGLALCHTASPDAHDPLLEVCARLGASSSAWRRIQPAFRRVPEPAALASTEPTDALAYRRRGRARLARGDAAGAVTDHASAIALEPDQAKHWIDRAIAFHAQTNLASALADLDRAVELDPASTAAHDVRGIVHYDLGHHDAALADFDRAIELDPGRAHAWSHRGNVLRTIGKYEAALADYDRACELDPDDATVYNNRGNARYQRGELDLALVDYAMAIQLDPDYAHPYCNRANIRRDRGQHAAALAGYGEAIAVSPTYADAYFGRARLHQTMGDLALAIADYDAVLALEPARAQAYVNRGMARFVQGDHEAAARDLARAVDLAPSVPEAWLGLAELRIAQGNRAEALVACERAIGADPTHAPAWTKRAALRFQAGDTRGALGDFDRAVALEPNAARHYSNRSVARGKLGDAAGARSDLDRALELDPRYAEAYLKRGALRSDAGDLDGAIADYEAAQRLDPTGWVAYANHGVALVRKKDYAGARAALAKALERAPAADRASIQRRIAQVDGRR